MRQQSRIVLGVMVGLASIGSFVAQADPSPPLPELCGYPYPTYTRFVVEDGGTDASGNPLRLCSGYLRQGGDAILGLPISRPFRVDGELYQAFEFGLLRWRQDQADTVMVDVLDLLHAAGKDAALERMGVPPALVATLDWLTDPALRDAYEHSVHPKYGLPTSPPTPIGPFVAQRFQRGLLRRWVGPPPIDLPGWIVHLATQGVAVERVMVGDLLRSSGLIPADALVADPGADAQAYNWEAAPVAANGSWSNPTSSIGGWDALFHRAGAFDVGALDSDAPAMIEQIVQASSMGLTLAVNGYVGRDSTVVQAGFDRNLTLIDTYPWGRIASVCGATAGDQSCNLNRDQLTQLETAIRHHLDITRRDDGVVGFWVLDDNPGDVRPAIDLIHTLVERENLVDRVARPTICGFGGSLDDVGRVNGNSRAAFNAAITNFTPTGCDAVALYPYGRASADDTAKIDWSMGDLLPYMLASLRERGWEPTRQPLIGIPQTFRFGAGTQPTAMDVETQTAAYCAAGASAILFYAWDDSAIGPKAELFNAADLRQGASEGLARCRAIWNPRPVFELQPVQ